MGREAGVPAGFYEHTTRSPKDIEIDRALLYAGRVDEATPGTMLHPRRVGGGYDRRIDSERAVLVDEPMDRLCQRGSRVLWVSRARCRR